MSSLRRLLPFIKPYWKAALIAPLLMVLEVAMDLAQPRLLQRIVDVGIAHLDLSVVLHSGLIMIGVALIAVVGGVGCTVFAVQASQRTGADIRGALFRKVQSFSFANLDEIETGRLITRLTNDVTQVQQMILMALRIMIRAPLLLVGSLIMAVLTSAKLALILLVLLPILTTLLVVVVKKAYPLFSRVQACMDDVNTVMQENLAGVRVVKAFVRGDHESRRFGVANNALMERTMTAMRLMAVVMPANMLILNLGIVAVIWFGGVQVTAGAVTVGQIMAFVNYLMMTLMNVMMVGMLLVHLSRAMASADRIQEVLDAEAQVVDRPGAISFSLAPKGEVVFDHVCFSYDTCSGDPVLRDVSFVARPGQTVAVLGATGSGKSSLVNLIARFYDVDEGRIMIDGTDIREFRQETLRHHISVALQESILFSGSIRDNIRYGNPQASDEEVEWAVKAAQAHDFIAALPEGYDTELGQRGVNLSGGQKQRVAIARAILTRPAVLILDDCTSSVDIETEAKIQDQLERLLSQTTCFIVAQRISSVMTADKILVLDDGKLVAEGTHAELIISSPIYQEIYESQLGTGVNLNG